LLIKHWNIKTVKLSPIGISLIGDISCSASDANVGSLHYIISPWRKSERADMEQGHKEMIAKCNPNL